MFVNPENLRDKKTSIKPCRERGNEMLNVIISSSHRDPSEPIERDCNVCDEC